MRSSTCILFGLSVACAAPARVAAQSAQSELASLLQGGPALSEREVVRRALANAPAIARAEAERAAAGAVLAQRKLGLLPQLEASARYQYIARGDLEVTTPDGQAALVHQFEHMVNGRIELGYAVSELFLAVWPRYEAARFAASAKALAERAQRAWVIRSAREAISTYLRARAHWAVARASAEQAAVQRADVEVLVSGEQLNSVELLRAETQLTAARAEVINTLGELDVSLAALCAWLNADASEFTEPPALSEELLADLDERENMSFELQTPAAMYKTALSARPELAALRASLAAAEREQSAADSGKWPQLRLVAGASVDNPNPRKLPQTATFGATWDLGAALSWSPNHALIASQRGVELGAQAAQLRADIAALTRAVRAEVWQAHAQARSAAGALQVARTRIVSAAESYRLRRELFRAGEALARDVTDDELALSKARLALVDAAIDWRLARARLQYATGASDSAEAVQ